MELGATHYTHWFQPLTGITSEKHDGFVSPVATAPPSWSSTARSWCAASPTPLPSPPAACAPPVRPAATPHGPHQLRFCEGRRPLHPHCIRQLHRRGAGQEDSPAALHERAVQSGHPRPEALRQGCDYVSTTVGPEQEYFLIKKEDYEPVRTSSSPAAPSSAHRLPRVRSWKSTTSASSAPRSPLL